MSAFDYPALAAVAYAHAEANYSKKGARFDVLVECYDLAQIAKELEYAQANTEAKAKRWVEDAAGLHHEQELNQAWDGPESVASSPHYDPKHDPAGDPRDAEFEAWNQAEAAADLEERWEHYAFEERNGMAYGSSF